MARNFLEFDHIDPVARGGRATVEGMRLRCRAHNQYEAEQALRAGFMRERRERARAAKAVARVPKEFTQATSAAAARSASAAARNGCASQDTKDLESGLRGMGITAQEARRAIAFADGLPVTSPEERLRAALRFLRPKVARIATGPWS